MIKDWNSIALALTTVLFDDVMQNIAADAFLPLPKNTHLRACLKVYENNPTEPISPAALAGKLGVTERHLRRIFVEECGITFLDWTTRLQVMTAKELLSLGMAVSDVAIELGFEAFASFSRFFKKQVGCTPSEWVKTDLKSLTKN